jgi:hypothetical protein
LKQLLEVSPQEESKKGKQDQVIVKKIGGLRAVIKVFFWPKDQNVSTKVCGQAIHV